ncbi:hypothetical protein OC846_004241 [Tilletia horrida]|uniref:Uncharacterized protein n=1 Tax=Tilletia horrida TaxID=155126 RepID=A0AAN6JX53_9BASI|nr:hypothetical protein OC846_004241 [Tilletia horrida]KAK0568931.1 hypothetical protein OC861_001458 [Tilletia horrida]
MSKPTALVIGASRGIGQTLVQQLTEAGYETYATVRFKTGSTEQNARIFEADLKDASSLSSAAQQLEASVHGLDLLVICGATAGDASYLTMDPERALEFFDINCVGTIRAVQAFLPALRKQAPSDGKAPHKTIAILTSLASNAGMRAENALKQPVEARMPISTGPYGASKAALNVIGIGLYSELEPEGFKVLHFHPGLVNTDMAQPMIARLSSLDQDKVPWTVIERGDSAKGIVQVIQTAVQASGPSLKYVDWTGKDLPW